MNNKIVLKRILAGAICALLVAGSFALGYFVKIWTTSPEARKAEEVLDLIDKYYVGDPDFDEDLFLAYAVAGALDRYSAYYSPADYDQVTLNRQGISKGRLGVSFLADNGTVIASVSGNSPAERAGITEGGRIVKLKPEGGEFVSFSTYSEFSEELNKYEKGEPLVLGISYDGEVKEFTLAKEDFVESYVWYQDAEESCNFVRTGGVWTLETREKPLKSHVNEGYAYIKFSSFNGQAASQLSVALGKMKSKGIKKLVLDIRGNGGGYMDILEAVASMLCPGKYGQTVALAKYKTGEEYRFKTGRMTYDSYSFEKIVMLANDGTASASEALIGAVLDYDALYEKDVARVIVSQNSAGAFRTYGKGIMQTTFDLSSGSAVKMTTAKTYWPVSNICIHGKGVTPETDERVIGVAPSGSPGEDAELEAAFGV